MSVSIKDKIFLAKHLAIMIKAGVPMNEALDTVIDRAETDLKKVLKKISADVINGTSLADSMIKHPKVFDDFFVNLVDAGEKSGNLENNLDFLAEQMRKDFEVRQKVQAAMMYPTLVLSATVIIGTGIAWFLLPKLIDLFSSFEIELPFTTKVLMGTAFLMKDYGALIFLGIVALITLMVALMVLRPYRKWVHRITLSIPVMGTIISDSLQARFCRNLGTLLKSGLPVIVAFEITTKTMINLVYADDLIKIIEEIKTGKSIYEVMEKGTYGEFDELTKRMIGVGEKSGNLSGMLLYLSEFYEEEVDVMSKNMSTLLEPFLLIVIALVVGFVAIAIISPIYTLIGGVGGQ